MQSFAEKCWTPSWLGTAPVAISGALPQPPNKRLAPALARRTKERRALRLHYSNDLAFARTTQASFARAVIYAVVILVAALLVERITIRPIAQRGTFVANRRFQHGVRRIRDPLPMVALQSVAPRGR